MITLSSPYSSSPLKKAGKKRINLSPAEEDFQFIQKIAKRDNVPVAKKTMELVRFALMVEENAYFSRLAEKRLDDGSEVISSDEFWARAFSS